MFSFMRNEAHASQFSQEHQCKQIHFFNIITPPTLQEGKLMIPNKFVEKYGEGLPNNLFLMTPSGAEWKMKVEKHDGKIWFQKGWKEFAEYHSLTHSHLLLFRYHRTSNFQVHIFDHSALEIDYPFKMASNNQGNKPPADENLEYDQPSLMRIDNTSLEFPKQYQMRSWKSVEVENTLILPNEALHHTDTNLKEKSKAITYQVTALDRASTLMPSNPFFVVVICLSYVHPHAAQLNLPSKFCWRHFDILKNQTNQRLIINLQGLNRRVWPTKFLIQKNKTKTRFRLSKGWKAFVKHNNLKVGDVCTFELIDKTKLTFFVHIFRETNSSNCSTSKESGQMGTAS